MVDLDTMRSGRWRRPGIAFITLITALCFTTLAISDPKKEIPPDDPSALTGPIFGDLPEGLPEANEGALEGGDTGTLVDARISGINDI